MGPVSLVLIEAIRDFTITNLGMRLTATYWWYTFYSGCLVGYAR
jgi:hypothetical protein